MINNHIIIIILQRLDDSHPNLELFCISALLLLAPIQTNGGELHRNRPAGRKDGRTPAGLDDVGTSLPSRPSTFATSEGGI